MADREFALDDLDNLGINELYVRRGALPTPGSYDYRFKVSGADRVLFGTSFPVFYNWMSEGVEFMKTLDITEEEHALITSKNAISLFNLKV